MQTNESGLFRAWLPKISNPVCLLTKSFVSSMSSIWSIPNVIKPEAMRFGSQNYANENVIAAIKRNTSISMLVSESIQLIFVFNENHGLVRCDVFPIYTGP